MKILLIFEGAKEEPKIMATIKELFFPDEDQVCCSYGHDTTSLYADIISHQQDGFESDIFEIVRESLNNRGDHSLDEYKSHDFESIYLFFDYDPQNDLGLDVVNERVAGVVKLFSEDTDNGMVFISYPMIESLYCEDSFPDDSFIEANVSLENCHEFKRWCRKYAVARNKELILFRTTKDSHGNFFIVDKDKTPERKEQLKTAWINLIKENVKKANLICNDIESSDAEVESITQENIFDQELAKYVIPKGEVSILSAFALFLYDYFHGRGDF